MRLLDQPWWPRSWPAVGDISPTPTELSQDGRFVTARLSSVAITLAVNYKGVQHKALIPSDAVREARPNDPDFLHFFCGVLGRYRQKPFSEVENIDLDTL